MKHLQKILTALFLLQPFLGFSQISGIANRSTQLGSATALSANAQTLLVKANPTAVFNTNFNNSATGRNDENAYLLCYLSTLIYPQYLARVADDSTKAYETRLHRVPDDFEKEYKKYTRELFSNPTFEFFHKSDRLGYDPEAMVISTANTIYVVFRGTDRVGSNKEGAGYDFAEWVSTDFDARQISSPQLTGKILSGMWNSLEYEGFKDEVYNFVEKNGGKTKKVWITGHSLGAAQAQLFAMFMAKKGITAQGVYGYAAPNPGNRQFANEMDRIFPNDRHQRFEFISDPITVLAQIVGCATAGTRVYYSDVRNIEFNARERNPAEFVSIIPGVVGAVGNLVTDFINENSTRKLNLDVTVLGNSTMCYHHPTWYLNAAYLQLTAAQQAKMPKPLRIEDAGSEGCDRETVERGMQINLYDKTVTKVVGDIEGAINAGVETIKQISFAATNIVRNVTGAAITEGDYYIKSYATTNGLGLNEQNGIRNGSDMKLTTAKSKVKIKKFGSIGYSIEYGTIEGKSYVLDSESESLLNSGSSQIQLWEKNNFLGVSANQRWLFINLEGNKYLIKNLANGKLLDANNDNLNTNSCRVKTYKPRNNDQTQIWVVEKAN